MSEEKQAVAEVTARSIEQAIPNSDIVMAVNDDLAIDEDDEEIQAGGDSEAFQNAVDEIIKRCRVAKIDHEVVSYTDDKVLLVKYPSGRQNRPVYISSLEEAQALLSIEFESYAFVGDYEAICSYQEGYVEASISGFGMGSGVHRLTRSLFGPDVRDRDLNKLTLDIPVANVESHVRLQIHLAPRRLRAFPARSFIGTRACITIEGLEFRTNERAVKLLETIADSLFFELDTRFNIPLVLLKSRKFSVLARGGMRRSDHLERKPLEFPDCQYDRQAISLYWYGRSAVGMPLLRFLAFYQSVEFYFPIFSQNEVIKHARTVLKDPRFSIHDDKDMTKLLSSIQMSRTGGFGDERSQFKATLNSCLNAAALREFLVVSEARKNFYTDSNHLWKTISTVKLALNDVNADLRGLVAERLYDIRCRIVHTKVDGGQTRTEVILPFSKESEDLIVDIELIQYVARQVLIATSSKLFI
jgi:hypothetical protein